MSKRPGRRAGPRASGGSSERLSRCGAPSRRVVGRGTPKSAVVCGATRVSSQRPRRSPPRSRPRAIGPRRGVVDAVRQADDLLRLGRGADVGRRPALVVDDRDLVALCAHRSIVRRKLCDVGPKATTCDTHASSPAAASAWSFVRRKREWRRRIRLDVLSALRPVEDVVGRPCDERHAGATRRSWCADVTAAAPWESSSAASTFVHAAGGAQSLASIPRAADRRRPSRPRERTRIGNASASAWPSWPLARDHPPWLQTCRAPRGSGLRAPQSARAGRSTHTVCGSDGRTPYGELVGESLRT